MNINFFQWIREGVRHSVLSGVADAVHQLGDAPHDDTLSTRLGEYLRATEQENKGRLSGPTDTRNRKRLGRSLREINPANASAKAAE